MDSSNTNNNNHEANQNKKENTLLRGLGSCTEEVKNMVLGFLARVLFAIHALVGVWRAKTEWNRAEIWLLLIPIFILVFEAVISLINHGGKQYKWFSPCVIIYLSSIVPSIWFLEFRSLDLRQHVHYCNEQYWGMVNSPGCDFTFSNSTYDSSELMKNTSLMHKACEDEYQYRQKMQMNSSEMARISTSDQLADSVNLQIGGGNGTLQIGLDNLKGVVNAFEGARVAVDGWLQVIGLDSEAWVLALHQSLLFVLIIGRWLLPTGNSISRSELSQLLLVFTAIAADILKFGTNTIQNQKVQCDKALTVWILAIWSASVLQFTLVKSEVLSRKRRIAPTEQQPKVETKGKFCLFCTSSEVWGILSTLLLQDAPFLVMRLYLIIGKKSFDQILIFFTFKNLLVVLLQSYRLILIAFSIEPNSTSPQRSKSNDGDTFQEVVTAKKSPSHLEGTKQNMDVVVTLHQSPHHSSRVDESPVLLKHVNDTSSPPMQINKTPSPQRHANDTLSPPTQFNKTPSPPVQSNKTPSPSMQHDKTPSPSMQHDKTPSPSMQHDKTPSPPRHPNESPSRSSQKTKVSGNELTIE